MRIFLAGVACVGKTTIGAKLAHILDYQFFDLDLEIEKFFGTSIERLRSRYLTPSSFRAQASQALTYLLARTGHTNSIIALPPSGLMDNYWKVIRNTAEFTIVALEDMPENILARITFYDADSQPIQKTLTGRERRLYLQEIKRDIAYFRRSYQRAHITVDIAGRSPEEVSLRIKDILMQVRVRKP
ncbi:MAG: shikimate kinase [Chthoniobacterales bacterium]